MAREVRKWWVYSSEEPSGDWPGTEFIGPYSYDEAKAVIALRPEFGMDTKSALKQYINGFIENHDEECPVTWTKVKR